MRRASLTGGLVLLVAVWAGPLPETAARSFAAHMFIHMTVVAIAAPLLAMGLAGSRIDPARKTPRAFAAVPASFVELAVVWVWHAPVFHHAAAAGGPAFAAEQASFLAAGLFFWRSVLASTGTQARIESNGLVALLLTFAHMTLLGALFALTPRPLYHTELASALADQQLGGVLMLVVSAGSYIGGALWIAGGLLRSRARA